MEYYYHLVFWLAAHLDRCAYLAPALAILLPLLGSMGILVVIYWREGRAMRAIGKRSRRT